MMRQFFAKLYMTGTRDGEDEKKIEEIAKEGKSYVRLPVETWLQVLCWIRRVELGLRGVPMSCRFLSNIAHTRLYERTIVSPGDNERSLGSLEIRKMDISSLFDELLCIERHASKVHIEGHATDFPDSNYIVPENIVRFDVIQISHVDDRALEFLRNISRLFVAVKLVIGWNLESMVIQHILPLCASIQYVWCSLKFLCAIQSNFPALLAQCQMLDSHVDVGELREDEFNDVLALLLKWFSTGGADGRLKVAVLRFGDTGMHQQLIRSLEKQFVAAVVPASFIVRIQFRGKAEDGPNPAEHPPIQNSVTDEQFSLQYTQRSYYDEVLITRHALCMPQAVQHELDKFKQKLISGGWVPDGQKIKIY